MLKLIGLYLIADGIISLVKYKSQSIIEQAIRVTRVGCGVILIGLPL